MDLLDLLREADALRSDLASPWRLRAPDDALARVGRVLAVEEQVRWDPAHLARLERLVSGAPGEPDAHAYRSIAATVLARSGTPGSAATIIRACEAGDDAVAGTARLSLASLARTDENAEALRDALTRAIERHDPLASPFATALAGQRRPDMDGLVLDFVSSHDTAQAAPALVTLVCGRIPDAADLLSAVTPSSGPVGVTRTALDVVVGGAPIDSLLTATDAASDVRDRWIGRCPHPRSVDVLRRELSAADAATGGDIVNSLALIGSRESLACVIDAVDDPRPLVAEAALHHVLQIGGGAAAQGAGSAPDDPRSLLFSARAALPPSDHERVFRGAPLDARTDVDLLYLGYLPRIVWLQLTACWAPGVSFDPYGDLVENLESMHALETWLSEADVSPRWVFQGRPVDESDPPGIGRPSR